MYIHKAHIIRPFVLGVVALSFWCGCNDASDGVARPELNIEPNPAVYDEIDAEFATAKEMAVLLPPLPRHSSEHEWGSRTTIIPGHLSVWLKHRKTKNRVMIVTVDDLSATPKRLERIRALPGRIQKFPAEKLEGNWIRALVGDRFEVVIRATDGTFYSQKILDGWFEKLRLDTLRKMAVSKKKKKKKKGK